MKIITVKCKQNEDNNSQIGKDVTGKYATFKYQNFETDYQGNPEKYFCQTRSVKDNELKIYRGSYTSGHFI